MAATKRSTKRVIVPSMGALSGRSPAAGSRRTRRRGTAAGALIGAVVTAAVIVAFVVLSSDKQSAERCENSQAAATATPIGELSTESGAGQLSDTISVSGAFARRTPDGGELIFSITNDAAIADRLNCVVTNAAGTASLYGAAVCNNDSTEVEEREALDIAPMAIVVLKPGGCVVALRDVVQPLSAGSNIDVVLSFRSGKVELTVPVLG